MFNSALVRRTNLIFLFVSILVVSVYFYILGSDQGNDEYYADLDSAYVMSYGLGNNKASLTSTKAKREIASVAELVIKVLKFHNFALLDDLVHPAFGVRLSPYSYIMSSDLILTSHQFRDNYSKNLVLSFGTSLHSEEIKLPFQEYYDRYIYSQDYANADQISYNDISSQGNVVDNTLSYYPKGIIVEYRIFSDVDYDAGESNRYLRLVFEEYKNRWFLSGIINVTGIGR